VLKDALKLTCGSIVEYYVLAVCSTPSGPSSATIQTD